MLYLKYLTRTNIALLCVCLISACGSGDGETGSETKVSTMQSVETFTPTDVIDPSPEVTKEQVTTPIVPVTTRPTSLTLQGAISYDRVLFHAKYYKGLDYDTTTTMPARGVTVELLSANGSTIRSTQTNSVGEYRFTAPINTDLRVRVLAELEDTSGSSFSVQVKDNTNGNALYVLDGALVNSGDNTTQTRNLHAESGWDGDAYSQARSSAPFAVLDSLYTAVSALVSSAPSLVLPPLNVYWSENNIAMSGSLSEGKIGTSFYTSAGPSIYLLGKADNDSDEFDRAVIQHEFGHYVEHQLSRTESLGGSHNIASLLDLRVAFGEAWGNAFAGMVSGNPLYRDSLGSDQGLGFTINVQARSYGFQGWFSEGSIQSILFNLFDDDNDNVDAVSLGFKPIFDVLTSEAYLSHAGFASIYPFIEVLKQQNPNKADDIQRLMNSYNIFGTGFYGENETNDAGSYINLPVYNSLTVGQTVNVCSNSAFQNYNGVDVYRLLKIDLPSSGTYTFSATKSTSFVLNPNPQMRIYQQGTSIASFTSGNKNTETGSRTLSAGTYILEVYEQSNAENNNNSGGLVCFNVSVN